MNSLDARRDEDVSKLRELEKRTGGRVRVTQVSGRPIETIALQLKVRTAGNAKFPAQAVGEVNARIQLAARYPFVEPSVVLSTRVFNPNVYESGRVCFGAKWLPTEYLDLLAQRLFKILAFDAAIINVMSAANGEAARWYLQAKSRYPADFPSDRLVDAAAKPHSPLKWTDQSQPPKAAANPISATTLIACPRCQTKLRLPTMRRGSVSCPACHHSFQATT
jgi:hypothetical protein